jgi:hypothetical protein
MATGPRGQHDSIGESISRIVFSTIAELKQLIISKITHGKLIIDLSTRDMIFTVPEGNVFFNVPKGKVYIGDTIIGTGGGGGGTSDHALLTHLDAASSGHTGFLTSGSMANYLQLSGGQNAMMQAISMGYYDINEMNDTRPWTGTTPDQALCRGNIDGATGMLSQPQTATGLWNFAGGLRFRLGTMSARPVTCVPGESYWAYDVGALSIGRATDEWLDVGGFPITSGSDMKIERSTDNMKFTIPSGGKYEFVVS